MNNKMDDDCDYEFPPSAYPGRELATFCLFSILIVAGLIWGGWKLLVWLI